MDKTPILSVLMPVFNSELFVAEAIESILNQTFKDFEFLILDDTSTDKSSRIIKDFEQQDSRIKVYQNEKNLGVVESRNKLISLSKGKYIAWLDSDDIAFEKRLEKQINFLEAHPEIGMAGAFPIIIDENGNKIRKWQFETDPQKLKIELFFHSPFLSSSVMIRKSRLPQDFYDSKFPVAEDFDLYSKISEYSEIANIAKFLVKYRINSKGLSKSNTEKMEQLSIQVIKEHAERLGIKLEENTIKDLRKAKKTSKIALEEIAEIESSLISLKNLLSKNNYFDKKAVNGVIQKYWFEACRKSTYNGLKILGIFFKSVLYCKKLSLKDNCRLFVRALIKY
jgi:glycosyltransferase involved in cell wall biosynthesis